MNNSVNFFLFLVFMRKFIQAEPYFSQIKGLSEFDLIDANQVSLVDELCSTKVVICWQHNILVIAIFLKRERFVSSG